MFIISLFCYNFFMNGATIKIRKTKSQDFAGVKIILEAAGLSGKWFTKKLFNNLLKKNRGLYFVAIHNGKIVGNIFSFEDGGYCAYLYKLAVDPVYRRLGVATRLLQKAIFALKARGANYFFGHVKKSNKASLALLKSLDLKPDLNFYIVDNKADFL